MKRHEETQRVMIGHVPSTHHSSLITHHSSLITLLLTEVDMRLYKHKVTRIADEITNDLLNEKDIELDEDSTDEDVKSGIEAILQEYIRMDQRLTEQAKDVLTERSYDHREWRKIKKTMAEQKSFGIGDETLDYLTNQIISWFMVTPHVAEVYVEDHVLRKRMVRILQRHMDVDSEIDREVRSKLRNVQEGTLKWEIEYDRMMREIKQKKGMV